MTVLRAARAGFPAALLALPLLGLLTGCGIAEELDREVNPARTSAPRATPGPEVAPDGGEPTATHPPARSGSAPDARPAACPESGVRVTASFVDAAMGLRATTLTLTNCGSVPYELEGYPALTVLDADREGLDVDILKGTDDITSGLPDTGPRPLTLAPGDAAHTFLAWRNTVTLSDTPAVDAPYLKVAPTAGASPQVVDIDGGLDLGNTGRLGATAWQRTER